MDLVRAGVWVWGTVTAVLAAAALSIVAWVGWQGVPMNSAGSDPVTGLMGIYTALQQCDSLVAGILGFSGLAWSHFFNAMNEAEPKSASKVPIRRGKPS